MKKIYSFFIATLFTSVLVAQSPQQFSYQAVIRSATNEIIKNKSVGMKISILQGSENGKAVYTETHKPTANENGLVSVAIGGGVIVSGIFESIEWSKGPYFIKSETDTKGGTNYELTITSQLLSVPFALYAGNGVSTEGAQGQVLTYCEGKSVWTKGGVCPARVASFDCQGVFVDGTLMSGLPVSYSKFDSLIPFKLNYSGGNQGSYDSQMISSLGVKGLKAKLMAGKITDGNGSLIFEITGTPQTSGTATFPISLFGQSCSVSVKVKDLPTNIAASSMIYDIDGNQYKTVKIGSQQWMAQNLKTTKYNDGTLIDYSTNPTFKPGWGTTDTIGYWYYINDDASKNNLYGKLYDGYVINQKVISNKNVCPSGWHVPTESDWTTLIDYLGGASYAGCLLKESGTISWSSPNIATNTSLFTALPGGWLNDRGSYYDGAGFWSASVPSIILINNGSSITSTYTYSFPKKVAASVRCIKD